MSGASVGLFPDVLAVTLHLCRPHTPADEQELVHVRDVDQARRPDEAPLQEQPEGQKEPVVPAHRLYPPMSQAPHGEVEEPAAPGLHAEARALLQHEGVLSENGQEIVGIVASNVTHEGVEGTPARRMQGHREDDRRIVLRDPAELAEGLPIVLDVLDDVEGADQVKAAVGERQGGDLAERCETAAGLQGGEGRSADCRRRTCPRWGVSDAGPGRFRVAPAPRLRARRAAARC